MAKLAGKDVSMGIDGNEWIIIFRKKTHIRSAIPLLPLAHKVIIKYNARYKEQLDAPLLPVYSNQKFNAYLHEIAEICGINKILTSHVGRRTFATTVGLANGLSIETISKIIGHSTIALTRQYAYSTDLLVGEEMQKLKRTLEN
jgi:site-specific recombinase XerD